MTKRGVCMNAALNVQSSDDRTLAEGSSKQSLLYKLNYGVPTGLTSNPLWVYFNQISRLNRLLEIFLRVSLASITFWVRELALACLSKPKLIAVIRWASPVN